MRELLETLITLMQKYTIADTAYVFAIVEGIATVVAAVGAIFAVIVTKKIAKNQNKLFEEQNKISATQADISKQQNRIALLEVRSATYDSLVPFFNYWGIFSESSLEGLKKIPSINSFQAYISLRELGKLDIDYIQSMNWFEFMSKHSEYFIKDMNCISQVLRLFSLPNEQRSVIMRTMLEYKEFSGAVHSMEFPNYSTQELEKIGGGIHDRIQSKEWMNLVSFLEVQISFNDL